MVRTRAVVVTVALRTDIDFAKNGGPGRGRCKKCQLPDLGPQVAASAESVEGVEAVEGQVSPGEFRTIKLRGRISAIAIAEKMRWRVLLKRRYSGELAAREVAEFLMLKMGLRRIALAHVGGSLALFSKSGRIDPNDS